MNDVFDYELFFKWLAKKAECKSAKMARQLGSNAFIVSFVDKYGIWHRMFTRSLKTGLAHKCAFKCKMSYEELAKEIESLSFSGHDLFIFNFFSKHNNDVVVWPKYCSFDEMKIQFDLEGGKWDVA